MTKRRGGDTHSSVDGNFHHRHLERGGEGHQFYDATYFISKAQVDAVGERIEIVRKRPTKSYKPRVPDTAVDECEESHEAADGRKEKTSTEKFDDTGLMALVCRHDIPLFLANIDTPGEQQKYAVALVKHLFSMLPDCATGVVLYDVACVLDRSLQLVSTAAIFKELSLMDLTSMISCPSPSRSVYFSPPPPCMHLVTSGHVNLSSILVYDLVLG